MMFSRDLFVAAYLLCTGLADTDCSSDITISSQSDADGISSCGNYSGALSITSDGVITLNGLQSVASLSAENSALSSLSAPELTTITGDFTLQNLTSLSTLSMPVLNEVGSISYQTLPDLSELQFNAGVQKADSVIISDTYLSSLSGLNLSDIETLNVNNNNNIKSINVSVTTVSNALDISFNSQSVNVSLPSLIWANNATFQFCGSISAPQLQAINNSLGFVNNTVSSLSFDNLATIGGLSISANSKLSNISFSGITELDGALSVVNNTNLGSITGFPNVETIRGALQFIGNFSKASMPSLTRVEGDVDIESSDTLDCSDFNDAHSNGDFFGNEYVCEGKSTTVSTTINTATQTGGSSTGSSSGSASASGSSGSSSSSKNAAPAVGQFGLASSLAVALFSLF